MLPIITIFVASTFQDMQAERDVLRFHILPLLQLRFRYRMRLRLVDLRWGVFANDKAEKARDRAIIDHCLSVVDRCHPFVLAMLGDRYGWVFPEEGNVQSVTHQEIERGILSTSPASPYAAAWFRSIENPEIKAPDAKADAALGNLKQQLKQALDPNQCFSYAAKWDKRKKKAQLTAETIEGMYNHLWARLNEWLRQQPGTSAIIDDAAPLAQRFLDGGSSIVHGYMLRHPCGAKLLKARQGISVVGCQSKQSALVIQALADAYATAGRKVRILSSESRSGRLNTGFLTDLVSILGDEAWCDDMSRSGQGVLKFMAQHKNDPSSQSSVIIVHLAPGNGEYWDDVISRIALWSNAVHLVLVTEGDSAAMLERRVEEVVSEINKARAGGRCIQQRLRMTPSFSSSRHPQDTFSDLTVTAYRLKDIFRSNSLKMIRAYLERDERDVPNCIVKYASEELKSVPVEDQHEWLRMLACHIHSENANGISSRLKGEEHEKEIVGRLKLRVARAPTDLGESKWRIWEKAQREFARRHPGSGPVFSLVSLMLSCDYTGAGWGPTTITEIVHAWSKKENRAIDADVVSVETALALLGELTDQTMTGPRFPDSLSVLLRAKFYRRWGKSLHAAIVAGLNQQLWYSRHFTERLSAAKNNWIAKSKIAEDISICRRRILLHAKLSGDDSALNIERERAKDVEDYDWAEDFIRGNPDAMRQ